MSKSSSMNGSGVDPTTNGKKGNANEKSISRKQQKLEAVNASMRSNEDDLASSKVEVLLFQNRVSSLESTILAGIQEKAKLLAAEETYKSKSEDKKTTDGQKESVQLLELQAKLKTSEADLATNKLELSRLRDRVVSLEYKIIAEIQEKARINLMNEDGDAPEFSIVSPTKRQKKV
ncbi:unnamed protein product [Pseudo-nitzschia multistriata]|uniref:Uncharacterized protein n=1 Tax=Pseudo-nitzschia multistriata TaxID=183589 RepID=A0A448Z5T2_9STRA|nr:unnamed protein product [Pseudo-nitzschia multistriata]